MNFDSGQNWILRSTSKISGYLNPQIILFLTIFFVGIFVSRVLKKIGAISKSKSSVLILGINNSGKTVLFYNLVESKNANVNTVSSITENISEVQLKSGKIIELIDYPGHQRLLSGIPKYLKNCSIVLFVIDSTTLSINIIALSQYLYYVLAHNYAQDLKFVFVCNKTDLPSAKTPEQIKSMLESELTSLCDSHKATLPFADDDEAGVFFPLGTPGKSYEFPDNSLFIPTNMEISWNILDYLNSEF